MHGGNSFFMTGPLILERNSVLQGWKIFGSLDAAGRGWLRLQCAQVEFRLRLFVLQPRGFAFVRLVPYSFLCMDGQTN